MTETTASEHPTAVFISAGEIKLGFTAFNIGTPIGGKNGLARVFPYTPPGQWAIQDLRDKYPVLSRCDAVIVAIDANEKHWPRGLRESDVRPESVLYVAELEDQPEVEERVKKDHPKATVKCVLDGEASVQMIRLMEIFLATGKVEGVLV